MTHEEQTQIDEQELSFLEAFKIIMLMRPQMGWLRSVLCIVQPARYPGPGCGVVFVAPRSRNNSGDELVVLNYNCVRRRNHWRLA